MAVQGNKFLTISDRILHTFLNRILVQTDLITVNVPEHETIRYAQWSAHRKGIIDGAGDAPPMEIVIQENVHRIGL